MRTKKIKHTELDVDSIGDQEQELTVEESKALSEYLKKHKRSTMISKSKTKVRDKVD